MPLGLIGSAITGFVGGAAGAYSDIAKQQQKDAAAQQLRQMEIAADAQKEKRVEEQDIRKEGRGMLAAKQKQQEDFAFANDPKNAAAEANTAVTKQGVADKYADSRFEQDLVKLRREAQAKHIESPDRGGQARADAHEEHLVKMAEAKNSGNYSKNDIKYMDILQKDIEGSAKRLEDITLPEEQRAAITKRMDINIASKDAIMNRASDMADSAKFDQNLPKAASVTSEKPSETPPPLTAKQIQERQLEQDIADEKARVADIKARKNPRTGLLLGETRDYPVKNPRINHRTGKPF